MEIREGIKYEYKPGKIATVIKNPDKKDTYYAKFDNGGLSVEENTAKWITFFKRKDIKLIEYPYKVGDLVVITKYEYGDPEGTIVQVESIRNNEAVNYTPVIKIGRFYGASFEAIRPAFKEEIPNYKQKVVKENYDYLIPILTKLDE